MRLPVMPPVLPMLAKAVSGLPDGDMLFEPKWDGFRCIVFRDGDELELGSRNDRPLTRYFPELVALLRAALPARCVVDGEIEVVAYGVEVLECHVHGADRMAAKTRSGAGFRGHIGTTRGYVGVDASVVRVGCVGSQRCATRRENRRRDNDEYARKTRRQCADALHMARL